MILEILLMLPKRVIRRWPAIILAVRRTLRDTGRIRLLRDSTKIMNGAIGVGVFKGRRWANIRLVNFVQLNVIRENQIGSPRAREIERWLEGVKT